MTKNMHVAVSDTVYSIKNAEHTYVVTGVNEDRGMVSVRTKDGYAFRQVEAKIFHRDPKTVMRVLGSQQSRHLALIRALVADSISLDVARREARDAVDRLNSVDMSAYEAEQTHTQQARLVLSDDEIETASIRPDDDSVMITHVCGASVVLTRQELIRIVALIEAGE